MLSTVRVMWEFWKRVGRKIGDVQARILLTVFYVVVLGPFAVVLRWTGDPLALKPGTSVGWRVRNEQGTPNEGAARQF